MATDLGSKSAVSGDRVPADVTGPVRLGQALDAHVEKSSGWAGRKERPTASEGVMRSPAWCHRGYREHDGPP
jgi:hypothetical protein